MDLIEGHDTVGIGHQSLGQPVSFQDGQMKAAEFTQAIDFRTAGHLRGAQRFQGGDPLDQSFAVGRRQVRHRRQTRQGPLHQLHTLRTIKQRFVHLQFNQLTHLDNKKTKKHTVPSQSS